MVKTSEYLGENGVRILWGQIASTLVGATIYAYFEGIVATFLSLVNIPLGLLTGFGEFLGELVAVLLGIWPALIRGSWMGVLGFVLEAGIAGYVVAIAIVLLALYIGTMVIRRAT